MTLYGNLSGEQNETFTLPEKEKVDHYFIEYTYSHDERNLLKKKIMPEGWQCSYSYLPGTHLCTKILQIYAGKIQERTFYTYDDNNQIIEIIEDDGSSEEKADLTDITFRKIKLIETFKTPNPNTASFGKPQQESEFYLDHQSKQMIPLKRVEFIYNAKGQEIKKIIYNSSNVLCYEINKNYDKQGRLNEESHPLGHITQYDYDDNNNKTREEVLNSGKATYYVCDLANRLIRKEEKHKNEESFVTYYAYNPLNQLISKIDPYGHETTYKYDRLGNQIQCKQPKIQMLMELSLNPPLKRNTIL